MIYNLSHAGRYYNKLSFYQHKQVKNDKCHYLPLCTPIHIALTHERHLDYFW